MTPKNENVTMSRSFSQMPKRCEYVTHFRTGSSVTKMSVGQ